LLNCPLLLQNLWWWHCERCKHEDRCKEPNALMLCKAYKQRNDQCKETNTMLWHKEIDVKTQVQSLDVNSNGEAQMRQKRA
jgi:hypothetical protein